MSELKGKIDFLMLITVKAVSFTHLDVYKRQPLIM